MRAAPAFHSKEPDDARSTGLTRPRRAMSYPPRVVFAPLDRKAKAGIFPCTGVAWEHFAQAGENFSGIGKRAPCAPLNPLAAGLAGSKELAHAPSDPANNTDITTNKLTGAGTLPESAQKDRCSQMHRPPDGANFFPGSLTESFLQAADRGWTPCSYMVALENISWHQPRGGMQHGSHLRPAFSKSLK